MHQNENYKKKGSGIAIYIDSKFKTAHKVPSLCITTADIEILTVSFTSLNMNYFTLGVYRPPSGNAENFIENFDTLISKLNVNRYTKIHIVGDFNFDLYHPERNYNRMYLDCLFSNGIFPIISRATHFQGINPTCIDHILSNSIEDIKITGVIPYNITHHMFTFSFFDIQDSNDSQNEPTKSTLCVNGNTISKFVEEFNSLINETQLIDKFSAKDSFHEFQKIFKELYDKWFLHEKSNDCKHVHTKSDWITTGLAKSSKTKNQLYAQWRKIKHKLIGTNI